MFRFDTNKVHNQVLALNFAPMGTATEKKTVSKTPWCGIQGPQTEVICLEELGDHGAPEVGSGSFSSEIHLRDHSHCL